MHSVLVCNEWPHVILYGMGTESSPHPIPTPSTAQPAHLSNQRLEEGEEPQQFTVCLVFEPALDGHAIGQLEAGGRER